MKTSQILDECQIQDQDDLVALSQRHYQDFFSTAKSLVLLLDGEMGAGKTTLVRYLAQAIGIKQWVNSPTFNLMNMYENDYYTLYHYDLYRITSSDELEELDFYERWQFKAKPFSARTEMHAIEWYDRVDLSFFENLLIEQRVYRYNLRFSETNTNNPFEEAPGRYLSLELL